MIFTFGFFKNIINEPKNNSFEVFTGNMTNVGNQYLLRMENGTDLIVYIHKVYFNSDKKPGLNSVMFISEKTKRVFVLNIKQINQNIKEIFKL